MRTSPVALRQRPSDERRRRSVSWSFTTTATLDPFTIFGEAAPPGTPDRDNTATRQGIELGVKLVVDEPGFITGVRFYKSTTNTGTHVGSLWTTDGQRLATATFTDETASES